MKSKINFYEYCFSFIICVAMICFATLFNDKEIIFPEAAALCVGGIIAPKSPWNVSKIKFILIMTICSIVGLAISVSSLFLLLKIFLGFLSAIICMLLFKSSLAPAISSCILPVLMGTNSIIYPISVCVISVAVVGSQIILEHCNIKEKNVYFKKNYNFKSTIIYWVVLLLSVTIYAIYPTMSGNIFLIAPPLIVMYCEMMSPEHKFYKKEFKICCFVIGNSIISSVLVYLFVKNNLPIILCAIIVFIIVLLLIKIFNIYFPPSAAIAFLPFIINENSLIIYPVLVSITVVIIGVSSFVVSKISTKSCKIGR